MKKYSVLILLLLPRITSAHHSQDHRMLAEDSTEVIAAIRPGIDSDWAWLLWLVLAVLLVLGIGRWWKGKS